MKAMDEESMLGTEILRLLGNSYGLLLSVL